MGRLGGEAVAGLSSAAQEAKRQAREAAGSLASQATEQVRDLADRQVGAGADLVAQIAESFRSAADSLEQGVPQLAGLARDAADRIDEFSESVRERSAVDLARMTAEFARRRPALLFGAAAIGGFLLVRLFTAPTETADDFDDDDFDAWDDGEDSDAAQMEAVSRGGPGDGA
jgi:hypothetical protein